MEERNIDNELFNPEEMQSPFESIKEVDAEGHEWWNSRKLALKVTPKMSLKVSPKVSSMFGLKSKYVRIRILPQKELATNFEGNVLIYRTSTGKVNVSVLFNNDTLWLSQRRMSELFAVDVSTINYHLKQLDETGEVHLSDAIRKIPILSDKWDEQGVLLYNLDAIIAVGYRVNNYEEAEAKALGEYEKFWRIQDKTILSDFDRFIEGLDKV